MLEKERTTLVAFGYLFSMILAFFGVVVIGDYVPSALIISIVILILYLYIIPTFIKRYYQMHGVGDAIGISRFIPIYNEITILPFGVAIAYVITTILMILGLVSIFLKPEIVASVFGDAIAFQWANAAIVATMFFIITWSIVKGIGYVSLGVEISRNLKIITDTRKTTLGDNFLSVVQYVLLYIPVLRAIGLMLMLDKINKIVIYSKMTEEDIMHLADGVYEECEKDDEITVSQDYEDDDGYYEDDGYDDYYDE